MKKVFIMLGFVSIIFLSGCASSPEEAYEPGRIYDKVVGEELSEDPSSGSEDPVDQEPVTLEPGQLTASEWNDNDNYEFFLDLFGQNSDQGDNVFEQYYDPAYFNPLNMISVHVHNNGVNLFGAGVELLDASDNVVFSGVTDAKGNVYLFPNISKIDDIENIYVFYGTESTTVEYSYDPLNASVEVEMNVLNNHEDIIEIMFVIDATGSMTDELDYLKSEISDVITQLEIDNPTATIKLALLFYRDVDDRYLTRYFDFTEDILSQQDNISDQSAGGGGDFPEAVSIALEEAMNKNWSDSNTTKLIFHVLDAPPHEDQVSMTRYSESVKLAAEKGIRLIPVASSGIDKSTEYLLRVQAMYTGGTYVFLTNDSGIGGDHIEATVGETTVEFLNALMIRLVNEYHTGVEGEVVPWDNQQ